ncbi:MAG: nucleotidyltransferase family protein [Phycisphaerae bacterium]|nr:nucleotidyltransferase family protein [Phycisphaerae bacterium]
MVRLQLPREEIATFCEQHQVKKLWLFGSVLRDDFGPDSDVDVLVEFAAGAAHSLFDMVRMEQELGQLLGRDVDLIERAVLEQSENYIRRRDILESLEAVHVA